MTTSRFGVVMLLKMTV